MRKWVWPWMGTVGIERTRQVPKIFRRQTQWDSSDHLMVKSEGDSMRGAHLGEEMCQPVISLGKCLSGEEQKQEGKEVKAGCDFQANSQTVQYCHDATGNFTLSQTISVDLLI